MIVNYINQLNQFGYITYDLIITDELGIEVLRENRQFPDSVTDEELELEAQRTIALLNPPIPEIEDITIDKPEAVDGN